ncbi:hypothetical protein PHMEG_00031000, partial [Phytophthora megakarya]
PSSEGSMDEGVSFVDTSAQASVGGAVKVEPPTEDRVSGTPQPVIDVESLDETVTIKEEGPLSTVQEEAALEEKAAPPAPTTPSSTPVSVVQDEPSRMSVALDVNSPTSGVDSGSQRTHMNEAQAKAYVAGQVQRWEREARERVLPSRVRYTWPNAGRDFEAWWTAMIATSRHLEGRTTSVALDEAWVSDLKLVRSELPTAQDVTPIVIPTSMLSPRDCFALIQTLLVEAGFSFWNVIPEWFRSRSSQIAPSAVRIAVEGVQHLLATELIEWRQGAFGATFQVADVQDVPLVNQDYHTEDADGDLLMTTHEAGLLGRDETDPKRPQHVPPRPVSLSTPSLNSLPSFHSSTSNQSMVTLNETMSSVQNVSSRAGSDLVPSLFATSGGSIESTRSGTSGPKSSQDESSSLFVWSLGQPAVGHMPFRAYVPIVMTTQGGAVQANTDDVVMSESGEVPIQSERGRDIPGRGGLTADKTGRGEEHPENFKPVSCDLRATSAQVQHATVTPVPDAASQIKTESGIANFKRDAKGQDASNVAVKKEKSADKGAAAALLAAQLQANIQSVNAAEQRTKPATTAPMAV